MLRLSGEIGKHVGVQVQFATLARGVRLALQRCSVSQLNMRWQTLIAVDASERAEAAVSLPEARRHLAMRAEAMRVIGACKTDESRASRHRYLVAPFSDGRLIHIVGRGPLVLVL